MLAYLDDVTAAGRTTLGDEAFSAAFGRGRASPADVIREELAHARSE